MNLYKDAKDLKRLSKRQKKAYLNYLIEEQEIEMEEDVFGIGNFNSEYRRMLLKEDYKKL